MDSPRYHRVRCNPQINCVTLVLLGFLTLIAGIVFGVLIKKRDEYNMKFHSSFINTTATVINTYVENSDYKCTCVQATCLPCVLYKAVIEVVYIGAKNESFNGTLYKDAPDHIEDYNDAVLWAINEYPIGDTLVCFYNTMKSGEVYWNAEAYTGDESKSRFIASVVIIFSVFMAGIICCVLGIYRMKCKACDDEEIYIPVGTV